MNERDMKLARQVGMQGMLTDVITTIAELEHFADLIRADEREKFCAVLRQLHDSYSLASNSNSIRARGNK